MKVRRLPSLLLLLALSVPSLAGAQDDDATTDAVEEVSEPAGDVVRRSGRVPEELEALRETRKRFNARTDEFEEDVRAFFEARKASELQRISDGYDTAIGDLEKREGDRRTVAIDKLLSFLERYPDSVDSDNIRFRLAELYYEKSLDEWLLANEDYQRQEEAYDRQVQTAEAAAAAGDTSLLESLPPPPDDPPKRDVGRSLDLYEQIIARNLTVPPEQQWENLDRVFYTKGFALNKQEYEQYDFLAAEAAFRDLIKYRPESQLRDAAHLFLGNILFNAKKDYPGSINEYQDVYERGPDGPYYYEAMFQLAWIAYKLSGTEWDTYEDRALELFANLLDDNESARLESGRESDFAPDARLNMARILSDRADRKEIEPYDVAESYFRSLAAKPYERNVKLSLVDVLVGCVPVPEPCGPNQPSGGRYLYEDAIDVLERLQTESRWANEPDNPALQIKLIWLLPRVIDPKPDDVRLARRNLVERYGEFVVDPLTGQRKPNPWWVANRNNPEALDQVRQYVEGSLVDVAVALAVEAQAKSDPELYLQASQKFREYLDRYPIADDYYLHQWNYANTMMKGRATDPSKPAQQFYLAAREFESLIRAKRNHPYGDGGLFMLLQARRQIVLSQPDRYGPLERLPATAPVERTYTALRGKEITVYKLSDDHLALLDAMRAVTEHEFTEPTDPTVQDFRDVAKENRAALYYIPAQILYVHNRYDEARPALWSVIEHVPNTDEASYAADLIIKSYENEGDLEQVRAATVKMLRDERIGTAKQADLEKLRGNVSFMICQGYIDANERANAATCFEQYLADFPDKSQDAYRWALFNSAKSYEIIGRAETANKLFEQYVADYPKDELSLGLFFRIAGNYESTFDLEKALYFYQQLIKNDREGKFVETPNAQFNVAFLKIGLGDHRGAATGFEAYHKRYLDKSDREQVLFMAGEEWEKVGPREARAFYERYLREYGTTVPDHALEAKKKLATSWLEAGNKAMYRRNRTELLAMYDKIVASGVTPNAVSRAAVAELAFEDLQAAFDEFTRGAIVGNERKDTALILEKDKTVPEFEKLALEFVGKYQDFDYSAAAVYLMGRANLYIADLGYSLRCPPDLSDDDCDLWMEIYDEEMRPQFEDYEQRAIARLSKLVERARSEKQWSEWIDKANEVLNRLNPFDYPAQKLELRGNVEATSLPRVRGREATLPDPKKEE